MWNEPSPEDLAKIPKLYATEGTPLAEKIIYEHFFIGSCDWFIAEYDGDDLFFGYADLGDPQNAEWGYVSYREMREVKVGPGLEVDRDLHWKPRKAGEIGKIRVK
jgi:hypothetical protein